MSRVDFAAASGKVMLLRAGLGDPELVTLKAVHALREAGGGA